MKQTDWKPCEIHIGYEQRINDAGHLETRPIGPDYLRLPWEKFTAKEWSLALQGLTPGGSEFVTPQECVEYIRKKFAHPSVFIEQRKRIAELEERVSELEDVIDQSHEHNND